MIGAAIGLLALVGVLLAFAGSNSNLDGALLSATRTTAASAPEVQSGAVGGKLLDTDDPRHFRSGALGDARSGCVWAGPGQNRYSGTFTDALIAAQLPAEVVAKLAIMRDSGIVSDRLELSSNGIRSINNQGHYGYSMKAVTLDDAVCFDTRVDIPAKVSGNADLYELVDAKRQRYSVMVVANGGNVAVLEAPVGR